jgi:hypothetical protein
MATTKKKSSIGNRLTASLEEIKQDPGKYLDQIVWVPVNELLEAHHPDNPRIHKNEDDVPKIAKSLLWFGWGEVGISFNPVSGRITGGHGRTMAVKQLFDQDPETFDAQWEKWLKEDASRQEIASLAADRFKSSYWSHCPVHICMLSSIDQKTLMVRLNDKQQDGKDDPAKMAAILTQIPKQMVQDTGWSVAQVDAFKRAFMEKPKEPEPLVFENPSESSSPGEEIEYEGKQYFERPDATDYSNDENDDFWDADATEESGPVITTSDGESLVLAQVDTSNVDASVKAHGVVYDSNIRQTRAVLLMSYDQLDEWKDAFGRTTAAPGPIPYILEKLDRPIDMARSIKEWRPDANLEIVRLFLEQHQDLVDEWKQLNPEPAVLTEEEDDGH